jgi:hypothetical protein
MGICDAAYPRFEVVASPTEGRVADLHVEGDAPYTGQDEGVAIQVDPPSSARLRGTRLALKQEFNHFVFIGF